eukprot:g13799.t1
MGISDNDSSSRRHPHQDDQDDGHCDGRQPLSNNASCSTSATTGAGRVDRAIIFCRLVATLGDLFYMSLEHLKSLARDFRLLPLSSRAVDVVDGVSEIGDIVCSLFTILQNLFLLRAEQRLVELEEGDEQGNDAEQGERAAPGHQSQTQEWSRRGEHYNYYQVVRRERNRIRKNQPHKETLHPRTRFLHHACRVPCDRDSCQCQRESVRPSSGPEQKLEALGNRATLLLPAGVGVLDDG